MTKSWRNQLALIRFFLPFIIYRFHREYWVFTIRLSNKGSGMFFWVLLVELGGLVELRLDKALVSETIHKGFLNPQTKCKLLFLLCVPNKSRRERPHRIFILPPQTEQLEKEGTGKQFRYILHSLSNSVCLPHQPLFLDFNSAQRKCYTSHSGSHL